MKSSRSRVPDNRRPAAKAARPASSTQSTAGSVSNATVADLLASLHFNTSIAEKEILKALRKRFKVPQKTPLDVGLQDVAPVQVFEAILEQTRPFALMVLEIYDFLAEVPRPITRKLEVHVPAGQARSMKLDPERFQQYERQIVERVHRPMLDPELLPRDGVWWHFHDMYHPPRCTADELADVALPLCEVCTPDRRAAFAELTHYYEQLFLEAKRHLTQEPGEHPPPHEHLNWDSISWQWRQVRERQAQPLHGCLQAQAPFREFAEQALAEFRSALRPNLINDVRTFLAMPYWHKRWELYEVWFVTLVLRSFGLKRLELQMSGDQWRLDVRGVHQHPIAVAHLEDGRRIEFFYQFQDVPPNTLFDAAVDRPEMLVYESGPEGRRCLLAAEVKARVQRGFKLQDMKGAILSLLEWEPAAIVGASYFDLGSATPLSTKTFHGCRVVVADGCYPGSESVKQLQQWLQNDWSAL